MDRQENFRIEFHEDENIIDQARLNEAISQILEQKMANAVQFRNNWRLGYVWLFFLGIFSGILINWSITGGDLADQAQLLRDLRVQQEDSKYHEDSRMVFELQLQQFKETMQREQTQQIDSLKKELTEQYEKKLAT